MTDINELFKRDPLQLTKPDIDQIVAYYREKLKQFQLGSTTVKKKKSDPLANVNLDDILSEIL